VINKIALNMLPFILSIILLIPIQQNIARIMQSRPVEEKLGFLPSNNFLSCASLNHKAAISEWIFLKALTYFGMKIDKERPELSKSIDYYSVFRFLDASTYIDPYNIDAYYFTEAVFTWDLMRVKEANYILERGIAFRTWDFYIPFFIGFNDFYFLKDYKNGAKFMEIAARITGDPLFTTLTSRLLYQSSQTGVAIGFLEMMIKNMSPENSTGGISPLLREPLEKRLKALRSIGYLEWAVKEYSDIYREYPSDITQLLDKKIITAIPKDPYGGRFYIDKGQILSSSNLAEGGAVSGNSNQN
jgi:hypothetical protein